MSDYPSMFVNRFTERNRLHDLLGNIGIENKCVIIVGESGVGKSELTQYCMSEYADKKPTYKVSIANSINYSYEEGNYLREIAKKINNRSLVCNTITLSQFIKRLTSDIFKDRIVSSIRKELIDKLPIGKNIVEQYSNAFFGEEEFNSEQILNSYNAEHYSLLKDYVTYILRENNIVLNIENIQCIDKSSLNDLLFIFKKSKGSILLLEFTPNADARHSLFSLITLIENRNIPIELINTPPLSIEDVRKIIDNFPNTSWELLSNSFVNWKGNLKPVMDLLTTIKYDPAFLISNNISEINNYTEDVLKNVDIGELQLLILITEHNEPVDKFLINELIYYTDLLPRIWNIQRMIHNLETRDLIKKDNLNRYLVSHDSIIFLINENQQWLKLRLIAKNIWYQLYQKDSLIPLIPQSVRLSKILYYASCLNHDNVIVSFLSDIYKEALTCKSPDNLIEHILLIREKLKKSSISRNEIDMWLICLYYDLANSNKAIEIIDDTDCYSPLLSLITILVYEDIGRKEDALYLCNNELKINSGKNLNYELALLTSRLMINFVLGNYQAALDEYNQLYANTQYVNLFEYGFLLRNAELIYSESSFKDSLKPIWESVLHFKKWKAKKMEAYSRITYGIQIALTGKFQIALKQFEIANRLLKNVLTERHAILNNTAVIYLYQGIRNEEVRMLLSQAMNTAVREFDNVAIHMNYLAYLDWIDDNDEAKLIITILLENLENKTFKSIELLAGCYYNIHKFYKKVGIDKESENYKSLILSLPLQITKIWRYRLYNEPLSPDDNDYIESTVNRCLSFISNWQLEIDNNLMKYE